MLCLLLFLHDQRFGKGCLWIGTSNVVSGSNIWLFEQCGVESFDRFETNRIPFDWHSPIGYLVAITIQYISSVICFTVIECLLAYGIATFLYALVATKDVRAILNSINKNAKSIANERQAFQQLCNSIQFHSILKQLSYNDPIKCTSFEMSSCILFYIFLWLFQTHSGIHMDLSTHFDEFFYVELGQHLQYDAITSNRNRWVFQA